MSGLALTLAFIGLQIAVLTITLAMGFSRIEAKLDKLLKAQLANEPQPHIPWLEHLSRKEAARLAK